MRRPEQLRELLLREISAILRRELDVLPTTLVTVTEVVLSEDMRFATIRVSIFPDSERVPVFHELSRSATRLRALLGAHLPNLNPLPRLAFELDERIQEAARVEELAEKVQNEK